MQPQLPIDVDPATGVWQTDALPMLYVPRHFFTNNHVAVEEALGRDAYAQILYPAGYRSAYYWCDKEARQHGLSGMAVFEHYLKRLSQRGWGLFRIVSADPAAARATIELRHSSFVLAQPGRQGKLCYMFAGWFAGAMDWVNDTSDMANYAANCVASSVPDHATSCAASTTHARAASGAASDGPMAASSTTHARAASAAAGGEINAPRARSEEVQCAAEHHPCCLFKVSPMSAGFPAAPTSRASPPSADVR